MTDPIELIKSNISKPIVLIGMMGTGKSHLGALLAAKLDLTFHDSDSLVEQRAGCSVAEIFERFGEEKFRQSEKDVILGLLKEGPSVLSTGGGAILDPETLEHIKDQGVSVWLDVSVEVLFERLKDKTDRPLLQTDNPLETLKNLLMEREPLYKQAHMTFSVENETANEAIERFITELSQYLSQ